MFSFSLNNCPTPAQAHSLAGTGSEACPIVIPTSPLLIDLTCPSSSHSPLVESMTAFGLNTPSEDSISDSMCKSNILIDIEVDKIQANYEIEDDDESMHNQDNVEQEDSMSTDSWPQAHTLYKCSHLDGTTSYTCVHHNNHEEECPYYETINNYNAPHRKEPTPRSSWLPIPTPTDANDYYYTTTNFWTNLYFEDKTLNMHTPTSLKASSSTIITGNRSYN